MSSSRPTATEYNNVGGILRAAREEKNIELVELAASLNLAPTFVSKIEKNDIDDIPLVYLRGYVRNYSRVLGIDSEPLLSALPEPGAENINAAAQELRCINERRRQSRKRIVVTLALLAVVFLLSYIYMGRGLHLVVHESEQSAVKAGDIVPLSAAASDNDNSDAVVLEQSPVNGQVGEGAESDDLLMQQSELSSSDDIVPQWQQLEQPGAVNFGGNLEPLELLLSGDCWIEIKDGGGVSLLTKMGSAGERIQLGGEFPFSILLGDATVVNLWFEGEQVDLEPHTRGSIARLYLP